MLKARADALTGLEGRPARHSARTLTPHAALSGSVRVLGQPCTAERCQPISCQFALQDCQRSAQGLASRSTSDAEAGLVLSSPFRADSDLA